MLILVHGDQATLIDGQQMPSRLTAVFTYLRVKHILGAGKKRENY